MTKNTKNFKNFKNLCSKTLTCLTKNRHFFKKFLKKSEKKSKKRQKITVFYEKNEKIKKRKSPRGILPSLEWKIAFFTFCVFFKKNLKSDEKSMFFAKKYEKNTKKHEKTRKNKNF